MPRIRSIKHEYFTNDHLAQASADARLLGIGLTTLADREGRLEDRPLRIRAQIFPYHPQVNCDDLLGELETAQFIHRYSTGDSHYIQIVNFHRHQQPHPKEKPSSLPAPVDIPVDKLLKSCDCQSVLGNGSMGSGIRDRGNGKAAAPRQEKPRRITPEVEPPFTSEVFIQSLATYKASRTRALKTESELLLYDDLREWGESESIIALTGAAKAGHLQVLHPDKYRHNGNGNGKTNYSRQSSGGSAKGVGSEIDNTIWDRAKYS